MGTRWVTSSPRSCKVGIYVFAHNQSLHKHTIKQKLTQSHTRTLTHTAYKAQLLGYSRDTVTSFCASVSSSAPRLTSLHPLTVVRYVIILTLAITMFIFCFQHVVRGHDVQSTVLTCLSLIIGAVPIALPLVTNTSSKRFFYTPDKRVRARAHTHTHTSYIYTLTHSRLYHMH